jgi:hypothetical protein
MLLMSSSLLMVTRIVTQSANNHKLHYNTITGLKNRSPFVEEKKRNTCHTTTKYPRHSWLSDCKQLRR